MMATSVSSLSLGSCRPLTSTRGCQTARLSSGRPRRTPATFCAAGRTEKNASGGQQGDQTSARLRLASDSGASSASEVSRRALLLAGALVAAAPAARADEIEVTGVPAEIPPVKKQPANCQILVVRKGPDDEAKCEWGTINGALDVAPEGSIILVSSGVFEERVVVRTPNITLRSIELDKAVIAWGTPNPYEAALQCEAPGLTVEGFAIKHASPSVASNYGVLVSSGSMLIKDCEVTSETGTGLGVEGGSVTIDDCRFLNNKRHGIMLLGPLAGTSIKSTVLKSQMKGNGGSGAVIRDGADVLLDGCDIQENADYGIFAKSASLELEGNVVCDNRKGPAVLELMDAIVGQENNVFDDDVKIL